MPGSRARESLASAPLRSVSVTVTPSEEPQPLRLNERVRISMPPDHPAAALDQKVGYAKTWLPKKGVYLVLVPPERTQLLQFDGQRRNCVSTPTTLSPREVHGR